MLHFDACGYLFSRSDRRLKEKDMMLEEEKNRAARAEEQVTRMNTKAKTLRRQVEDAVSGSTNRYKGSIDTRNMCVTITVHLSYCVPSCRTYGVGI